MIWIKFVYEKFHHYPDQPDDYIGPFPEAMLAAGHKEIYGPVHGLVVRLDESEIPEECSRMTPGEHVDYMIKRAEAFG